MNKKALLKALQGVEKDDSLTVNLVNGEAVEGDSVKFDQNNNVLTMSIGGGDSDNLLYIEPEYIMSIEIYYEL